MDNQRLILLLVFIFSLFMLWDGWQRHNLPIEQTGPVQGVSQEASAPIHPSIPQPTQELTRAGSSPESASLAAALTSSEIQDESTGEPYVVTTDLFHAEISPLGGDLLKLELLQHKSDGDQKGPYTLLERHQSKIYVVQTGLIGSALPTHKTRFALESGPLEMQADSDRLTVRLSATESGDVAVSKIFTFHRNSYLIDVEYEVQNHRQESLAPFAYFQFLHDGTIPKRSMTNIATFTGPAIFTEEGKFQKVAFSDISEDRSKAKYVRKANDGWLAMVQHYFVAGWLPQGSVEREFYLRKLGDNLYSAGIILPVGEIAPGQTGKVQVPLYAGPQEQAKLKKIAPGFNLVVDYGWLTVIATPIYWLLEFIHRFIGNWGWSIILLTLLIKAVFYPLSATSYRSMAKMKLVTPKMMKLKEQYGSDRARMNQEMMELYRKEKINPLGGCLPIMIQIPVFIALYWVLLGSVEMRNAPWMFWITDLSTKDPYYVLPIIMGLSMLIQMRLNPTPPDPIQAKVMMAMPIVFTFMFLWFPSGLVLYWTVNNVVSIAQQWQIKRVIEGAQKTR